MRIALICSSLLLFSSAIANAQSPGASIPIQGQRACAGDLKLSDKNAFDKSALNAIEGLASAQGVTVVEYNPLTFWSNLRLGATYLSNKQKATDLTYAFGYKLSDIKNANNTDEMKRAFELFKDGSFSIGIPAKETLNGSAVINGVAENPGSSADMTICVLNLDKPDLKYIDFDFAKAYAGAGNIMFVSKDKNALANVKPTELWSDVKYTTKAQ